MLKNAVTNEMDNASDELTGLHNFNTSQGSPTPFAGAAVSIHTLSVDSAVAQIALDRLRATLAYADTTPEHLDRAEHAVRESVMAWERAGTLKHVEGVIVEGQPLLDWAQEQARTYLHKCRKHTGESWPVRALQGIPRSAPSLEDPVRKACETAILADDKSLYRLLIGPAKAWVTKLDLPAAEAAIEIAMQIVSSEIEAARNQATEARAEFDGVQARRVSVERNVREAYGQTAAPPVVGRPEKGIIAAIRSLFAAVFFPPEPLPAVPEKSVGELRGRAESQAETGVTEFVAAATRVFAIQHYIDNLERLLARLEEYQAKIRGARYVFAVCSNLAENEMDEIRRRIGTLGANSLNSNPGVDAYLRERAGQSASCRDTLTQWFEVMKLADPLSLGDRQPQWAYTRLCALFTGNARLGITGAPRLAALSRQTPEEVLAALPPAVLAGIVRDAVEQAHTSFVYQDGLAPAPRIGCTLFVPGGDTEASLLAQRIREYAMLRQGVNLAQSPRQDTIMAVVEAHNLSILQLPGIAHAYRAYCALPAQHDGEYDQEQAFADKRAHALFTEALVSREALLEILLMGLAFGKILDTAAQSGRAKGSAKLVKLVPDDEVEHAFVNWFGARLRLGETLGSSIPEVLKSLADHPEWVAEIRRYVESAVKANGTPVVLEKLRMLKAQGRFRKDPELAKSLEQMISRENIGEGGRANVA